MADVVPVTDVREPDPVERAEALAERHRVGEHLQRVGEVGEAVDHRDRGVLGELLDLRLLVGANHDRGEEAREDERGVAVGLPARELELRRGEEERHPAELGDPDLEGDARSRGRLVEDEPDRAAGEKPELAAAGALCLQLVGEVEEHCELVARPARDAGEATALQLLGTPAKAASYNL